MAARYERQKGDVLAGVVGLRAPDGSIIKTTQFYKPTEEPTTRAGQMTENEKEVCEGIVSTMTDLFGEYVRAAQALERGRKAVQHGT